MSLRDRGYAVLDGLYTQDEIARMREALSDLYEAHERPPLYAPQIVPVADDVEISGTGLVFYRLLKHRPELAEILLRPEAVDAVRAFLGDDIHIELVGGVISDETRPMFSWHTHVGAIDGQRRVDEARSFERPERVVHVIYLHDVGPGVGELLVLPRRADAWTSVLGDPHDPNWPGAVSVRCSAGSVVLLEERTWHCVLPKAQPGMRMFLGCYFASSAAAPPQIRDASLEGFTGGGSLFQSVLRRA